MTWRGKLRDLRGPFWRQFMLPPEIKDARELSPALVEINKRWPLNEKEEQAGPSPVFILSAGWGSGSTLMQRLIMSSGEILVWGEPLDQAAIIQRLGLMMACMRSDWPPQYHFNDNRNMTDLSKQWVANLVPPFSAFRSAQITMLETWLGVPDTSYGAERWGLKEVRLTIDHARYLKWLFPQAKFIFIYRNLYDCYRSCKGVNWYSIWPRYKVSYPITFARHWKTLVEGFVSEYEDVGGLLVKYEDLISGQIDLDEIAKYVGVDKLDGSIFEKKMGARSKKRGDLSLPEKFALKSVAGRLQKKLGYCQ